MVSMRSVSIRSPHRSKGRPSSSNPSVKSHVFQSAPLTEARGDPLSVSFITETKRFNPLPSPKQGETTEGECAGSKGKVSIRSPHRSKGRRRPSSLTSSSTVFQSAPLTEARGDFSGTLDHPNEEVFQSAPLTEARGDFWPHATLRPCTGFNPLPSPKQGETWGKRGTDAPQRVSIRSPHRSKGRRPRRGHIRHLPRFQSAPLTEARGDAGRYNQRNNKDLHRQMRDSVK